MPDVSKLKGPDDTTLDILSKTTRGIVRATMESTSTSTAFVVTAPGITSLYDGATFICKNTIVASASGCTMNVNGLGAKSMWATYQNSAVTTMFAKNQTYLFIFDYTNDRWDVYDGKDTNDNDRHTIWNAYSHPVAGVNGLKKYSLFARLADGTYSSFFTNAGGTGTKTFDTETEFDFSKVFYANISEDIAAGSVMTGDGTWYQCGSTDMRYSFTDVKTSASTSSLHADAPVYLRVSCSSTKPGFFKLVSPYFTQTPTFGGGIYVFLGYMRDSYRMELHVHNPIYNCRAVTVDNTTTYVLDPWFEGIGNKALNPNSHAEGYYNTASGDNAHVEGAWNVVSGANAHAEGNYTTASGQYGSHSEGRGGTASGNMSHCEGYNGQAIAPTSHVEGYECVAYSDNSHAEGAHTTTGINGTQTFNAHAEGNTTTASASSSHSEGYGTTASGDASHAEGYCTTASGDDSHAEGARRNVGTEESPVYMGKATGYASHSEGYGCDATGLCSHAEGGQTTASGSASHAEGDGTIAAGVNQHVSGRFNISDDDSTYAEIIGNGTSENNRSNARTLDWNGNEVIAGSLTTGDTELIILKDVDTSKQDNDISSTKYPSLYIQDKAKRSVGKFGTNIEPGSAIKTEIYSKNYDTSGTQVVQNTLQLNSYKDGTASIYVSHADKWRDALGVQHQGSITNNSGWTCYSGQQYCTAPASTVTSLNNNTNTHICTLKLPVGLYVIIYMIRFNSNATGRRYMSINSSNAEGSMGVINQVNNAAVNGDYTCMQLTSFINATTETTIYFRAYQNSGAALGIAPRYNVLKIY